MKWLLFTQDLLMLNIYDLEKKWLRYKLRSFLPGMSIFIVLLIVIIAVYVFIDLKKLNILDTTILNTITKEQEHNISKIVQQPLKKEIPVVQSKDISQEIVTPKRVEEAIQLPPHNETPSYEKNILEPSIAFMDTMQNKPIKEVANTQKIVPKNTVQVPKKQAPTTITEKPQAQLTYEANSITIKKQNTYEDIDYVIKRFKKNNNPALSLFVAKKYYELGEYKQAYNYALITNEINNNIEASWIIFSKSLVKLNQKSKAIQTLQQYINHSNSNQAKVLLKEIVSGKFK